jgi:hypothetical protein
MPSTYTAPNNGMQATAYSLRLAVLGSGFPPRLMPSVRQQRKLYGNDQKSEQRGCSSSMGHTECRHK